MSSLATSRQPKYIRFSFPRVCDTAKTWTHASRLLRGIIRFNRVDSMINTVGPCLLIHFTKYSRRERKSVRCTCTLSTSLRHTNPWREHSPTSTKKMLLMIINQFYDESESCVRIKDCVSFGWFVTEKKPVKTVCSRLSCCASPSGWLYARPKRFRRKNISHGDSG